MMALADPPVMYRAFISYSHRDAAFARRLHRQLESYRLPAKLVGSETARGTVPARLSPIFRDREELSAGESLSDQVLAALAASEALIIICSPHAKASVWVGKEIENFRLLHPTRPVLAALIDGEPDEAFPPALTQIGPELREEQAREPIAADFRKGKDGHRLARLKLAAGLTGVALDALVQRDAQRQFRRVIMITVAAVVALLVMAGLLVMALQARQEADRQREEAEGLVEYMLTDLRDKLTGVGRINVMTAVNERAMAYYGDQQSLAGLSAESLNRRARILHAMGEDDEKRGDLDKALIKFKEAHRTTEAVLAQNPNEADAIYAHGLSEYWVGDIFQQKGDFRNALEKYRAYLNLAKQGAELPMPRAGAENQVGWAESAIGITYLRGFNEPETARVHFERYRAIFEKLVAAAPKDIEALYSLSDAYAWVAESFERQRIFVEARKSRKRQLELIEALLLIEPQNDRWLLARIAAERSLFRACLGLHENNCAAGAIARAGQYLAAHSYDASNLNWQRQAAYVALDAGFLAVRQGNIRAAKERSRQVDHIVARSRAAFARNKEMLNEITNTQIALKNRILSNDER